MMSHTAITCEDGVRRYWYIRHINTKQDACLPRIGDIIECDTLFLKITYIGYDQRAYPVWVGNIFGAKDKYGLNDDEVIAWGRKGIARSFPFYLEGNYYVFTTKKSYLWT